MPSFAWLLFGLALCLFCTCAGFVWGMDTERGRMKAVKPSIPRIDKELSQRFPMTLPQVDVDRERWLSACRENYRGRRDFALRMQEAETFWTQRVRPKLMAQVAEDTERGRHPK